jgi:hypothetical protein
LVAAEDEPDLFVVEFDLLALDIAGAVDEVLLNPADNDRSEGSL